MLILTPMVTSSRVKEWVPMLVRMRSAASRAPTESVSVRVADELLATVSSRDVGLADGLADKASHLGQHVAPHQMAVTVVDRFEEIEVHHQHRDRHAVAMTPLELHLEGQVERFLGQQTG